MRHVFDYYRDSLFARFGEFRLRLHYWLPSAPALGQATSLGDIQPAALFLSENYRCPKFIPGPSTAMRKIKAISPAVIHHQLRVMAAGDCGVLASGAFPADQGAIQMSPDAPPNEAAADEIKINIGPTGLNNPDMQKAIPPLR